MLLADHTGSGVLKCWGRGALLGLGSNNSRGHAEDASVEGTPVVELNGMAVALSLGSTHTCAVLQDRSLKCWGENSYGQLGYGDVILRGDGPDEMGAHLPVIDLGGGRVFEVATGDEITCALLEASTDPTLEVKCWGRNRYRPTENDPWVGLLGLGDTEHRGDEPLEMGDNLTALELGGEPRAITCGRHYSCALLMDGILKCWGYVPELRVHRLPSSRIPSRISAAWVVFGRTQGSPKSDVKPQNAARAFAVDPGNALRASPAKGLPHDVRGSVCLWMNPAEPLVCARHRYIPLQRGAYEVSPGIRLGDHDRYNYFGALGVEGHQGSDMGFNLAAVDLGVGRTAYKVPSPSCTSCTIFSMHASVS